KNDSLRLFFHKDSDKDEVTWSNGSSLLDFKGNVRKDKFVDVEVIDLLEFLDERNFEFIDIIKIDIEGAEVELLNKIIDSSFYKKVGHIFVETHDHKIPELVESTNSIRSKIAEKGITNISLDWI